MASVQAVIQDARIDGMKAALKLTPDQEKYWTSFQAAVSGSYELHNQTTASTRQSHCHGRSGAAPRQARR
jgi:hypothetical protein